MLKPEPEPEPSPMARAFDHVYLRAGDDFWGLSSRARSHVALRELFHVARSFRPPVQPLDFDRVDANQYATLSVFGAATDVDLEVFLTDYHAQYPDHPYPAALLDPAGRTERWP
jgi:hypothetical protein